MAYTVIWTEKALKSLKPLPKKTAARIVAAVEKIRDEPRDHMQQLRGSPYFKLRVGGYRVILDIRKKVLIVYVVKVGKRENVYNNL
jgi:mRNA interferase RelE/StbE